MLSSGFRDGASSRRGLTRGGGGNSSFFATKVLHSDVETDRWLEGLFSYMYLYKKLWS